MAGDTNTTTAYGTALEPWMQEHVQNLLDKTGGIRQEDGTFTGGLINDPEAAFEGERIAGFNEDQFQAHELGREGIGSILVVPLPYATPARDMSRSFLALTK